MNIKQIEEQSGIPRANIRYYEQQGLLAPVRQQNGYRDYSPEDLEALNKIRLLRQLGLPVETIRRLQTGEESLPDVLAARMDELAAGAAQAGAARQVCASLRAEQASYQTLNAEKYLAQVQQLAGQAAAQQPPVVSPPVYTAVPRRTELLKQQQNYRPGFAEETEKTAVPPEVLPPGWQKLQGMAGRRFLARWLDLMLYSFLLHALLHGVFQLWPLQNALAELVLGFMPVLMMLFVEPLLLRWLRTTPGKWLLGLRLQQKGGYPFDYSEGLIRTWRVFTGGMGANIPPFSLWRLWKSYNEAWNGGNNWQEYGERYLIRDEKRWRVTAGVLLWAALFAGGLLFTLNGLMPRYRSESGVTAQQFANNFNRYVDCMNYSFDLLQPDGSWVRRNNYVVYVDGELQDPNDEPQFAIETGADGMVHRITYQWRSSGFWASPPDAAVQLAMLSFAAAQPEANLWTVVVKNDLYDDLEEKSLQNYTFESCGVRLTYRFENHGYQIPEGTGQLGFYLTEDGWEDKAYLCGEFVLEKLP
ncbi:MAG: MerR family transcriptional regulator [Faecalibacterium sp.]|nr:MerR family transcriptional regulator [Faecalibacterium sp.]